MLRRRKPWGRCKGAGRAARPQARQHGWQRGLPGGDDAAAARAQLRVRPRVLFQRLVGEAARDEQKNVREWEQLQAARRIGLRPDTKQGRPRGRASAESSFSAAGARMRRSVDPLIASRPRQTRPAPSAPLARNCSAPHAGRSARPSTPLPKPSTMSGKPPSCQPRVGSMARPAAPPSRPAAPCAPTGVCGVPVVLRLGHLLAEADPSWVRLPFALHLNIKRAIPTTRWQQEAPTTWLTSLLPESAAELAVVTRSTFLHI